MSDLIWETFDALFTTLHKQNRRVEELEARVEALERRLQERAAAPTPYAVAALLPKPPNRFAFGLDPDAAAPPPFAPLGVTLYDAEGKGTPLLFPGAEKRIVVLGVDNGSPEGDRAGVVILRRE